MPRDLIDELLHGRVKATLFGGDRAPRLGRLVILEPIGAGAMGTVFAAYDPRLDRRVAVKLLRGGGDDEANQRVLAEARALGQLAHPNVVAVHDADEVDGSVYIVMELAPGPSLRGWLETDRSWREIVDVMRQAALGLAAAHRAGVVHRDIKPDNILIGPDRVRIVDFGLAARRADDADPASTSGGTPSYMAPEVLAGGPATEGSDQFSFGVTLFEAMYGARPYRAVKRDELVAAARAAADAPRPAGTAVPGWLHAVATRALAADPARRFASLDAIADELGRDRRRRRRIAGASAGVMAALAVTGAIAYRGGAASDRDPCGGGPARREAAVPVARTGQIAAALGDAAWATKAGADLVAAGAAWEGAFRRVCEATRVGGAQSDALYALRMRCLDRRLDRIAALTDALVAGATTASPLSGGSGSAVAGALTAASLDAEAREDAAAAITALAPAEACETVVDPGELALPVDTRARGRVLDAERELDRAWAAYVLGRYADARTQVAAIDAATADLAGDAPGLRAAVLVLAGSIEARIGDPAAARVRLDAALAAAATAHAAELEADVWSRLLRGALFAGEPDRAIEWAPFARAAAARVGLTGAEIDGIVGEALRDVGELAAARDALTRALASPDPLRGDRRALLEMNLGSVELAAGRPAAADAAFARGLTAATAALGADHPGLALYIEKRAAAARARGALADALAGHDRALALRIAAFGARDRSVATSYLRRAQTRIEAGRIADAEADLALARSIRTDAYPGSARLGEIDVVAGDAALAAGRRADALAAYRRAASEDRHVDVAARLVRAGAPETVELAPLATDRDPSVDQLAAAAERIARLAATAPERAGAEATALRAQLPCTAELAPAFLIELGAAARAAGALPEAAACYRAAIDGLGTEPGRSLVLAYAGLAQTDDDIPAAADAAIQGIAVLVQLPELDPALRAPLTRRAGR